MPFTRKQFTRISYRNFFASHLRHLIYVAALKEERSLSLGSKPNQSLELTLGS